MVLSSSLLGSLLGKELVEEEPLDDDGLAGEQGSGGDGGGRGSSGQDKTTWDWAMY